MLTDQKLAPLGLLAKVLLRYGAHALGVYLLAHGVLPTQSSVEDLVGWTLTLAPVLWSMRRELRWHGIVEYLRGGNAG